MNRILIIACILIFTSCFGSEISKTETNQYRFSETSYTNIDSTILETIQPYKTELDKNMNEVLGKTNMAMMIDVPEGLLGNLVADIILNETNDYCNANNKPEVDFCLLNNGGLRSTLPQGDITRGKIFELMPFENEITILELDGETTFDLINFIAEKGGMPVAGLTFEIETLKPINININKQVFNRSNTYRLVTSDYLANGGDNVAMLNNRISNETIGLKIRDAIINYFIDQTSNGKIITSQLDGRIKYAH